MDTARTLRKMYRLLDSEFGDLGWWPGGSVLEIMLGAVLTQNTAWSNVEKALACLRRERMLSFRRLSSASPDRIARCIRPAGYYRAKTGCIKDMCSFITSEAKGRPSSLGRIRTGKLRDMLLSIRGVGPETADSILLYAFDRPVFVVDAYTRRIFSRHGLYPGLDGYDELKEAVERDLPCDAALLNQFHALIVEAGKKYCGKKEPLCSGCPLERIPLKGNFRGAAQGVNKISKRKGR